MKRTKLTLLIMLSIFSAAVLTSAQTQNPATVAQINKYVASLDKIAKDKTGPDTIVADTADHESKVPKWKKFDSTESLEKFREETSETYTIANNWLSNGKIVLSVFTEFSPSGDWTRYVTHYFRANGSLAKVESEMRTFYGDYIIVNEMYYNSNGRRIKSSVKYLDLTTNKPKKPTKDVLDANVLTNKDHYKKATSLPFYKLIDSSSN